MCLGGLPVEKHTPARACFTVSWLCMCALVRVAPQRVDGADKLGERCRLEARRRHADRLVKEGKSGITHARHGVCLSQALPAGSDAAFQQTLREQQQAAEPASRANAVLEWTVKDGALEKRNPAFLPRHESKVFLRASNK